LNKNGTRKKKSLHSPDQEKRENQRANVAGRSDEEKIGRRTYSTWERDLAKKKKRRKMRGVRESTSCHRRGKGDRREERRVVRLGEDLSGGGKSGYLLSPYWDEKGRSPAKALLLQFPGQRNPLKKNPG